MRWLRCSANRRLNEHALSTSARGVAKQLRLGTDTSVGVTLTDSDVVKRCRLILNVLWPGVTLPPLRVAFTRLHMESTTEAVRANLGGVSVMSDKKISSAIFSPDSEVGRSLPSSLDGQLRLPFPSHGDEPCLHCGDRECDGECLEDEVSDYLDQFYPEVKNERI